MGFLFLFLGLLCGSFCLCACLCFCFVVISCISWYFVFRCCFLLLAFVLSAVSFCLCRLFCALVVASPHLFSLVLRLGLARGWKVFWGMGGGWGGAGSMPEAHCAFHLRLRGGGCAHALAREGKRQQRSRGRHSSTEDGASWLKKEKELQIFLAGSRDLVARTAQRTAQVGSRRKKNCRFPWQAAEISWHAQHRGRRKLAQEGKRIADFPGRQQRFRGRHSTEDGASWLKKEKKCRFRGRHSKEAKDSKVLFYFWFLNGQAHSSYLSISAVWDFYRRWGVQSRKGQGSSPMCLPLSITLIKCNARVFVSTQGCRALNQANV